MDNINDNNKNETIISSNKDNDDTAIIVNNNKCNEHTKDDIVGICIQCDNTPVCMKCIIGKGAHYKHDIGEIICEIIDPILKELQTITIPKLNESLKHSKSQLDQYDNQLYQLKAKHTQHIDKIKSTFQKLHNNMTSVERDLIRQLDTTLNENKEILSVQHSIFDSNIKLIDILNTSYNNSDNNNIQHNNIEILKHNHQCKKLLSQNNNSSSHFSVSQLDENNSNIDEINDSIKSLFTIKTTHSNDEQQIVQRAANAIAELQFKPKQLIPTDSKEVKWGNYARFQLIRKGVVFKEGTQYLAADSLSKLSTTSFPPTTGYLMLLDGFNESLESIPKSIKCLFIYDIKLQLIPGSIPNHIEQLFFCDGFNQIITKGIIPPSVTHLYISNIGEPLNEDSIPNTVTNTYSSSSFKHLFTSKLESGRLWTDHGKYEYL